MEQVRQTTSRSAASHPPGPKGHAIWGNIADLKGDILGGMHHDWEVYGDLVRYRIGPALLYSASAPQLAEAVLVQQKQDFIKIYRTDGKRAGLQLALGTGLLTNGDHESWLSQRRMMQPIFHRRSINTMTDQMVEAGEQMLSRWQQTYPDGSAFNLFDEMMHVTLDIVNRTMFSENIDDNADVREVGHAVTVAAQFTFLHQRQVFKLPLFLPLPRHLAFKRAMASIDTLIYGMIEARRASDTQHDDLLDMLLAARDEETGEGMTVEQLRDEVTTIFAAGHETTANALTWTWYLLSQHPDVLKRLQDEVDTVLNGRVPTLDDLSKLPYTLAVFQESMRLFPPAPLIPRLIHNDTDLGGCRVQKGARIVVNVHNIHRHPDHWQDAERFNPDRFLQERQQHKMAYMPFGGGPHLCIGNHFAMMEGQILLAMMAQRVELRLVPGHPVEKQVAITMRPKYGMQMTVHGRR